MLMGYVLGGGEEKGEVKERFWASQAPGYMVVPFTEMENSVEKIRLQGKDKDQVAGERSECTLRLLMLEMSVEISR